MGNMRTYSVISYSKFEKKHELLIFWNNLQIKIDMCFTRKRVQLLSFHCKMWGTHVYKLEPKTELLSVCDDLLSECIVDVDFANDSSHAVKEILKAKSVVIALHFFKGWFFFVTAHPHRFSELLQPNKSLTSSAYEALIVYCFFKLNKDGNSNHSNRNGNRRYNNNDNKKKHKYYDIIKEAYSVFDDIARCVTTKNKDIDNDMQHQINSKLTKSDYSSSHSFAISSSSAFSVSSASSASSASSSSSSSTSSASDFARVNTTHSSHSEPQQKE
ncbi:hypothetical protein RFI_31969, partial [Reticulomyxa filosa]